MSSSKAIDRLRALADECESKARAYRLAAEALNGHDVGNRAARGDAVLAEAVALDKARRRGRGPDRSKRAAPGSKTADKLAARARTVAALDALDTARPLPAAEWREKLDGARIAIGPLVNSGYVRKKAGGFIRTAKPYDATAVNHPSK